MSVCPYLVVLFCLVQVGLVIHVSESTPSPPPNPECPGMHKIAQSLNKGIQTFTQETTNCRVNNACTGLMCNGTHKRNDFYMKMELKHCKTPPEIHLDLIYKDINFHHEMKEGLYKISKSSLGQNLKLKLTLNKKRNRITTGLEIQGCTSIVNVCGPLFTLLQPTTFCLNMKTCAGYNSTGDLPCHLNPTGITPVITTIPVTPLRTASNVMTAKVSSKRTSTTLKPRSHPSTQHSGTTVVAPEHHPHAKKRGSGLHPITAAVAAGIGLACVTAVLVMIAAAYYWKRFYRRSRLRAAYYNDISMNDPLYEDFGPEEA